MKGVRVRRIFWVAAIVLAGSRPAVARASRDQSAPSRPPRSISRQATGPSGPGPVANAERPPRSPPPHSVASAERCPRRSSTPGSSPRSPDARSRSSPTGRPVKTYRIALGSDPVRPKEREGDGRTPEGSYYVCIEEPREPLPPLARPLVSGRGRTPSGASPRSSSASASSARSSKRCATSEAAVEHQARRRDHDPRRRDPTATGPRAAWP